MSSSWATTRAITGRSCSGASHQWSRPVIALRPLTAAPVRQESNSTRLRPRITEPSIWKSVVPKFLRSDGKPPAPPGAAAPQTARPSQPLNYNPLAVYVVLFLLIGSNAINIVGLKNEVQSYRRATDAKIDLLKEVIQRVHKGEDVDVAAALGTGNEKDEDEWEAVIREIEKEDEVPNRWKQKPKPPKSQNDKAPATAENTASRQPPETSVDKDQKTKALQS